MPPFTPTNSFNNKENLPVKHPYFSSYHDHASGVPESKMRPNHSGLSEGNLPVKQQYFSPHHDHAAEVPGDEMRPRSAGLSASTALMSLVDKGISLRAAPYFRPHHDHAAEVPENEIRTNNPGLLACTALTSLSVSDKSIPLEPAPYFRPSHNHTIPVPQIEASSPPIGMNFGPPESNPIMETSSASASLGIPAAMQINGPAFHKWRLTSPIPMDVEPAPLSSSPLSPSPMRRLPDYTLIIAESLNHRNPSLPCYAGNDIPAPSGADLLFARAKEMVPRSFKGPPLMPLPKRSRALQNPSGKLKRHRLSEATEEACRAQSHAIVMSRNSDLFSSFTAVNPDSASERSRTLQNSGGGVKRGRPTEAFQNAAGVLSDAATISRDSGLFSSVMPVNRNSERFPSFTPINRNSDRFPPFIPLNPHRAPIPSFPRTLSSRAFIYSTTPIDQHKSLFSSISPTPDADSDLDYTIPVLLQKGAYDAAELEQERRLQQKKWNHGPRAKRLKFHRFHPYNEPSNEGSDVHRYADSDVDMREAADASIPGVRKRSKSVSSYDRVPKITIQDIDMHCVNRVGLIPVSLTTAENAKGRSRDTIVNVNSLGASGLFRLLSLKIHIPPPDPRWGTIPRLTSSTTFSHLPAARTSNASTGHPIWSFHGARLKLGRFQTVLINGRPKLIDQSNLLVIRFLDQRFSPPKPLIWSWGEPKNWNDKRTIKMWNDRRRQTIKRATNEGSWVKSEREYLRDLVRDFPTASIMEIAARLNERFEPGRTAESVRAEYLTYKDAYDKGAVPFTPPCVVPGVPRCKRRKEGKPASFPEENKELEGPKELEEAEEAEDEEEFTDWETLDVDEQIYRLGTGYRMKKN